MLSIAKSWSKDLLTWMIWGNPHTEAGNVHRDPGNRPPKFLRFAESSLKPFKNPPGSTVKIFVLCCWSFPFVSSHGAGDTKDRLWIFRKMSWYFAICCCYLLVKSHLCWYVSFFRSSVFSQDSRSSQNMGPVVMQDPLCPFNSIPPLQRLWARAIPSFVDFARWVCDCRIAILLEKMMINQSILEYFGVA